MAKAKKLPSGNYRVQVYIGEIDGKKKMKSFTAPTKKEAEYLAMQYQVSKKNEPQGDCTIKDAIDDYISHRTNTLSPSTIKNYRVYQRNAYADIEDIFISKITSERIQIYINSYSKSHSAKTVRNACGLLISSIHAVNPDKAINVRLPQKEVIERHIPTDKDIQALLDSADRELRLAILLASMTTMRRGEICALTYEDINGNRIHVHSDMVETENYEWVIKKIPKTNASDRYIDVPDRLIEEIGTGTGRILSINPNIITNRFGKLRNRLGINTRFHDLRHYAASIMHAIGIPDQYIMEVGGWSSDGILKSVYRNVLDDKKNEFTERRLSYMDKFF